MFMISISDVDTEGAVGVTSLVTEISGVQNFYYLPTSPNPRCVIHKNGIFFFAYFRGKQKFDLKFNL